MKALFISSGNSKNSISPIVQRQGESLIKQGIDLHFFTIKGKGILGYFSSIFKLKKIIKENHFDIYHAHYSFSAIVASLAGAKPIVVSLMGSDVKANKFFKFIIWFLYKYFWNATIVKSEDMKISLDFKNVYIIPNGVDLNKFQPLNPIECKKQLEWDFKKTHLLFAANPARKEKNFKLTKDAYDFISDKQSSIELHFLEDVSNNQMPIYFNASNVIVLTSFWEGSPNVIKEAMACNIPIVSTDVGDVKWLFGETGGHFICSYEAKIVAENIKKAIAFAKEIKQTQGRQRIIDFELDSESIAKKLIIIYRKVLKSS